MDAQLIPARHPRSPRIGVAWFCFAVIVLSAALPAKAQEKPAISGPGGSAASIGANAPAGANTPSTVPPPAAPSPGGTGTTPSVASAAAPPGIPQIPDLSKRENFSAAMQMIVLLTVLSLAPAILLMMTSFTRIVIVLSLLRQALGAQSLPPNQVLIGLAMFMTFLIMGPTWSKVNDEALKPYMDGKIDQQTAMANAEGPVRDFMIRQISKSGNDADVDLFSTYNHQPAPKTWGDVKTTTLIPAFMLSELKTAFLRGFKIYLPFLIIDMVISTVLISMGMMMLPPAMISLPFKLLLFVLVNGWHLIVGNLMGSFG
jgi:flagellar biosynthetic protein FliP